MGDRIEMVCINVDRTLGSLLLGRLRLLLIPKMAIPDGDFQISIRGLRSPSVLINLDLVGKVLDLTNEVMLLIDDDLVLRVSLACCQTLLVTSLALMLQGFIMRCGIIWDIVKPLRCWTHACLASPPFIALVIL